MKLLVIALLVAGGLAVPPAAAAQSAGSVPALQQPREVSPDKPVVGRNSPPRDVIRAARNVPKIARELRRFKRPIPAVYVRPDGDWQVSFFARGREIAQVRLVDGTLTYTEAWTGIQVPWIMARGYEGAFGRKAAALPVWLGLLLLMFLPFLRPPLRMLHLDLAVLASLSVSLAFFTDGRIDESVPLAYPPLLYLLVRLVLLARRPAAERPLKLLFGTDTLLTAIGFLVATRIVLQIINSNVIDVGYAGVIGADRIAHGEDLYGNFPSDNPNGDTYGPLLYLAYLPFELVLPWQGMWDDLPAGHAAAAVFDLLCALGLYVAGRQARGELLGLLLAYLWLACPFTLFAANSGAHDPLVGALVLTAVALSIPSTWRGLAFGAAVMTKFAPLALLPIVVRSKRFAIAAAAMIGLSLVFVVALEGGLGTFWERTIAYQDERSSPFSVWGLYDLPELQRVAQVSAVLLIAALAIAARDRVAAAAAALIAVQLGTTHWFYLYVVWFLPVALVALTRGYAVSSGRSTGSIDVARPDPSQRMSTPISQGSSSAGS